ncbi:pimeloyl-ACP methyl ester carboxylesterase [Novosphingobium chloroacetimidivorans]|uniref:Pimeloyl-ACP methyl ester carboxylesterase n=1 Tax=Novosphingobium chloroacetimidivorans TaxID=1428314 RepID=A0A7W7K9D0_9SPHN|nr:alpha/beta hydrolase [Novosphingobium chloroacetimidivorans]MBB4858625.1 pimeloyl-ACP methyl ester carboxylesterase [Novosphingobium chloroacetimidivorans]
MSVLAQVDAVVLPNGVEMKYHEWAGEGPTILFLHPSTGYGRMWEWTVDALDGRFHAYAPDQRGHGGTSRPDGSYSAEAYADDLVSFMDAVGISRAIIVGHSLGGRVAQVFAARYADRVSALVLVASPHLSNFYGTRDSAQVVLRNAAATLDHPETFASKDEALAFMRANWPWSPEGEHALEHRIAHNFEHHDDGSISPRYDNVRVAQGLAHLSDDLRPYAAQVSCPVMIVRATSGNLPADKAEAIAKFWRDARVVDVEGRYALQMESPVALANAIAAFASQAGLQ